MRQIAEDILVGDEFYGANVGCVVTSEGAVLIDAPIVPSEAKAWRSQVMEYTEAELVYAFVTDSHPTHAIGAIHFDLPVIANERAYRGLDRFTPTMRERVLDIFRDWAPEVVAELTDFEVLPPEITFDQDLTLHKGERTLRFLRMGGHMPATSVLFVEEDRVLFAGDLVTNGYPPYVGQGNSGEWLEAVERIRELQPRLIVPGHGRVCGLEAVDRLEDYLLRLRQGVLELAAEGRSRAETATRMLPLLDEFEVEDRWRKRAERSFRTSVGRVYEEMKKSPSMESETTEE